jgi:hypothetical protein
VWEGLSGVSYTRKEDDGRILYRYLHECVTFISRDGVSKVGKVYILPSICFKSLLEPLLRWIGPSRRSHISISRRIKSHWNQYDHFT